MEGSKRQSYGSDIDIQGTDLDPVYATQVEGIEEMRFDVPDGTYSLILHFSELRSDIEHEALVYNLDDDGGKQRLAADRIFSVMLNDEEFLSQLSKSGQLVPEKALSFKTTIVVEEGEGVSVKFLPVRGEPFLNGIQLSRIR